MWTLASQGSSFWQLFPFLSHFINSRSAPVLFYLWSGKAFPSYAASWDYSLAGPGPPLVLGPF